MVMMSSKLRIALSVLILGLIVGVPLWYASFRYERYRRFRTVEDGVLYRSGQLTVAGMKRVIEQKRIKTVINLRDGSSVPDQAEEAFCRDRGVRYVRIPVRAWWSADGTVPQELGLKEFFDIMRDPKNHPVLIHCFAGHHRTGGFCAAYRMEFQHWTQEEAIHEMEQLGYHQIYEHNDIHTYLSTYHSRKLARAW
jgi:protein tyrosine/serine phosphatase